MQRDLTSTALSPRRLIQSVPIGLPYELSWADLWSCLPGLDLSRTERCRAFEVFAKQGRFQGTADSSIVTIRYPTQTGEERELTMFIKLIVEPRLVESTNYAFLAERGVRTPTLLASVPRGDGEIIVTEFLPTIGIDTASVDEVHQLLEALAGLNSVNVPPGAFEPGPGNPVERMDAMRRAGLERLALDPRAEVDADRWFQAFDRCRSSVPSVPRALTHGEFSFQQCGWTDAAEPALVLFDLGTLALRPRFSDVGSILPTVAHALATTELELLEVYLGFVRRFGGSACDLNEAMEELRLHRILGSFSALHWMTHEVYEAGSDQLLELADGMRADMVAAGLL